MSKIPMVLFLHFLCLSASLNGSLYLIPCADDDSEISFPFVCLLAQTNALISLDLEVRLCKLLFIRHIDSTAACIKNTWTN